MRLFFDEYIWFMATKNLSILKMSHFSKIGRFPYPNWLNGILFYYLDQRHYFGVHDVRVIPTTTSLPRLPSNPDMVSLPMLSRVQSFDHMMDNFTDHSTHSVNQQGASNAFSVEKTDMMFGNSVDRKVNKASASGYPHHQSTHHSEVTKL
jgi:hypothetical protein